MPESMICPLLITLAFIAGAGLASLMDWIDRGQTESRKPRINKQNPEQPHDHQ